jgi:ribosome modulation factor
MARNPKLTVVGGPGPADQSPGSNSKLSDQQEQALHFGNHVPAYEKALAAKKKADADFKNVCKTIKSEGGSIESIKLTIKLRTPEGEKEFKEMIERQRRIAEWNNLAIGQQGWLLDEDRRPLTERAFAEGRKAGLEGKDCKPPHAPNTEAYEAWIKGWQDGQASLAAGIRKSAPQSELLRPDGKEKARGADEFDASADGDRE